jgi:hypothetical protein
MRSIIEIGYALRCADFDDDRSVSSLSGYGTDYSTSDGSVGFESPFEEAPTKREEGDSDEHSNRKHPATCLLNCFH